MRTSAALYSSSPSLGMSMLLCGPTCQLRTFRLGMFPTAFHFFSSGGSFCLLHFFFLSLKAFMRVINSSAFLGL